MCECEWGTVGDEEWIGRAVCQAVIACSLSLSAFGMALGSRQQRATTAGSADAHSKMEKALRLMTADGSISRMLPAAATSSKQALRLHQKHPHTHSYSYSHLSYPSPSSIVQCIQNHADADADALAAAASLSDDDDHASSQTSCHKQFRDSHFCSLKYILQQH